MPASVAVAGAAARQATKAAKADKKRSKREADACARAPADQLVSAANASGDVLEAFPPAFRAYTRDGWSAALACVAGHRLSGEQRAAVWELFELNMRDVYAGDQQRWCPAEKRRELFHEDARYLLLSDAATQQLVAFTHFRFEVEENLLAQQEMEALRLPRFQPVLYCYELQLSGDVRRRGVGRRLMQMLELLALKHGMELVLLTVQRGNDTGRAFYDALGYRQHPSCPERDLFDSFDGVDPGHRILFRDMRRAAARS